MKLMTSSSMMLCNNACSCSCPCKKKFVHSVDNKHVHTIVLPFGRSLIIIIFFILEWAASFLKLPSHDQQRMGATHKLLLLRTDSQEEKELEMADQ